MPKEETTGNLYHIVTGISTVAMKNYKKLRLAFSDDCQDMLAWSCRNLLELDIFTKYVLISKANSDEFAAHRLIDGIEIAEQLKDLELVLNPNLSSSAFDPLITEFNQKMDAEAVVRTRFLSTRKWATAVAAAAAANRSESDAKMVEKFDTVNKVCSKLVHPTAWAILTDDIGSRRFPDARHLFYGLGAECFMSIFVAFKGHVKQFGLVHPPKSADSNS